MPEDNHGREHVDSDGTWQVVDCTELSPEQVRGRIEDLRDGREADIEEARTALVQSLGLLRVRLGEVQVQIAEQVRAAAPAVAGAAALGATSLVVARLAAHRSATRRRRAARGRSGPRPVATA